jgi:hypothetical protein
MKPYGFVEPTIDATQYNRTLGGTSKLPLEVLAPDGQWDADKPVYEPQAEHYETWGCTDWGWLNAIEFYLHRKFGITANFIERYIYILAHIREPGADPHHIAEVIRHEGLIETGLDAVPPTYAEFIEPDPLPARLLVSGQHWLNRFSFTHEWVLDGSRTVPEEQTRILKENLRYSPLGISVTAWYEKDGVYIDGGAPNNHWCVLYGWTDRGWKVFDSYDHSEKIVSFDHNIRFAKRFHIGVAPKQKAWPIDLGYRFRKALTRLIALI